MKVLFENFLDDESEYVQCQELWETNLSPLLNGDNKSNPWVQWINNVFANGRPMRDGNPIVSYFSESASKCIRVVQVEFHEDEMEFSSWNDQAEINGTNFTELVIHCYLTENSLDQAKAAIKEFVN